MSEKNKRSHFGPLEPGEITDIIAKGWRALEDVAGDVYHRLPPPVSVVVERSERLIHDVTGVIKGVGGVAVQKFHSDENKDK